MWVHRPCRLLQQSLSAQLVFLGSRCSLTANILHQEVKIENVTSLALSAPYFLNIHLTQQIIHTKWQRKLLLEINECFKIYRFVTFFHPDSQPLEFLEFAGALIVGGVWMNPFFLECDGGSSLGIYTSRQGKVNVVQRLFWIRLLHIFFFLPFCERWLA